MALHKGFIRHKYNSPTLLKNKILIGISIILAYSVSIYLLLTTSRDLFRLFTITQLHEFWELSYEELQFYNLFFAALSALVATSIAFEFWWKKPKKAFGERNLPLRKSLTHQSAMNWVFMSWFTRLGFLLFAILGMTLQGGFKTMDLYADYWYAFVMVIIVLFLQQWSSIQAFLRKNSLRYFLLTLIAFLMYSYFLSRIQVVDYQFDAILKDSLFRKHKLELPQTSATEKIRDLSIMNEIFLMSTDENSSVIVVDNQEVSLHQLGEQIVKWQSQMDEVEKDKMIYKLYIDQGIQMSFVNRVKSLMSNHFANRVAYAVKDDSLGYDNWVLKKRLLDYRLFEIEELAKELNNVSNVISVMPDTNGAYMVNDIPVEPENLKSELKELMLNDSNYVIQLFANPEIIFSDYFYALSVSKEIIDKKRDELAIKTHGKSYFWLWGHEKNEIKRKVPWMLLEMTPELLFSLKKYRRN